MTKFEEARGMYKEHDIWELDQTGWGYRKRMLEDGWEPISVTNGMQDVITFRRLVQESSLDAEDVRAKTLKEVGKWLASRKSLSQYPVEHALVLSSEIDCFERGEMP